MVVFAHYVLAFQPMLYYGRFGAVAGVAVPSFAAATAIAQTPLVVAFSPQFGVAIFFVLSGFVLAASVTSKPAPLPELALRRWLRLSLPVLLTTVAIWLWLATGWHPDIALAARNHSDWLGMNFTWVAWQANDLGLAAYQALVDVYARDRHWWNTSLWTIRIELWGSLALFAAYAGVRRWSISRRGRVGLALAAAVLTGRTDYAGFALGAALFELQPVLLVPLAAHLATRPWRGAAVGGALLAAALLLGGTPVYVVGWTPYLALMTAIAPYVVDPLIFLHRLWRAAAGGGGAGLGAAAGAADHPAVPLSRAGVVHDVPVPRGTDLLARRLAGAAAAAAGRLQSGHRAGAAAAAGGAGGGGAARHRAVRPAQHRAGAPARRLVWLVAPRPPQSAAAAKLRLAASRSRSVM